MNEENETATNPEKEAPVLGKFKSVDALAHAYTELEAEFTRRSQKLKAYEEAAGAREERDDEALFRAVTENQAVKERVVNDYLQSLRGVPLMGGAGAGVTAPVKKPASIAEAGRLALGYLRETNK